MTMTAAADDNNLPSPPPPPPPPSSPNRRQASVRLSQGWINETDDNEQQQQEQEQHQEAHTGTTTTSTTPLPTVVAFFPLPYNDSNAGEDLVPPPSPRSPRTRKVAAVPGSPGAPPLLDLTLPELDDAQRKAQAVDDARSDAADAAVKDFISDTDFSSVGTVASQTFSEGMADEIWEDVPMGPSDAILGMAQAYRDCTDTERKVNICVGAYRDDNGQPWVLPSVKVAERRLWESVDDVKEYLPIEGDADFVRLAMQFAYGPEMPMDHLAAVQTVRSFLCSSSSGWLGLFQSLFLFVFAHVCVYACECLPPLFTY